LDAKESYSGNEAASLVSIIMKFARGDTTWMGDHPRAVTGNGPLSSHIADGSGSVAAFAVDDRGRQPGLASNFAVLV
jgi:hypothetical protein